MALSQQDVQAFRDLAAQAVLVYSRLDHSDDKQRRLGTKIFELSAQLSKFKADKDSPQLPLIEEPKAGGKSKTEGAR